VAFFVGIFEVKMRYVEMALTLGSWGQKPFTSENIKKVVNNFAGWARKNSVDLTLELYAERENERKILREIVSDKDKRYSNITPLVRVEPRSDRLKRIAADGGKNILIEVPASNETGDFRFMPHGVKRSPSYAAEMVREATLLGLIPEIALNDITRAKPQDVLDIIKAVKSEAEPRGITPRWRLVDIYGFGDPLPRALPPKSLAGWVRYLHRKSGVKKEDISVQASDQLGLALANTLSAVKEGAQAATSLFGLGAGAGWAASELLLFHSMDEESLNLKSLKKLKAVLDSDATKRDQHRPLSGERAFEFPAGTSPEEISDKKRAALIAFNPEKFIGTKPLPLLTSLSGHAGMLHLMHRFYSENHFDSDNPETLGVSAEFESEFKDGRQQPVSWQELEPKLKDRNIL